MSDGPHHNVTFPSGDGQAHGYLALPSDGGQGPGLVVIQEWWGLTDHIRDVTDRFADQGFAALAPDLFGGRTTHDADEAARLMQDLPVEDAARDLSGAVDFLLGHDAVTSEKVGAVGFCMGGGFVLVLGAQRGDAVGAVVCYYGVGGYDRVDLSGMTAAVLGHFGSEDDFASPDAVRALGERLEEEAGIEADLRIYEGAGHAFFNDENHLGTYAPGLADRTWRDTVAFLHEHVPVTA